MDSQNLTTRTRTYGVCKVRLHPMASFRNPLKYHWSPAFVLDWPNSGATLAMYEGTPAETLVLLAEEDNAYVSLNICWRNSVPLEVQLILAKSKHDEVRQSIGAWTDSIEVLDILSRDPSMKVLSNIVYNVHLTESMLTTVVDRIDTKSLLAVSPLILERDDVPEWLKMYFKNDGFAGLTPKEFRTKMLGEGK